MVCPHTETYSALIVFTSAEKLLGDEEQSPTNRMVDKKLVPTNGNFCSLLALRRRFFSGARRLFKTPRETTLSSSNKPVCTATHPESLILFHHSCPCSALLERIKVTNFPPTLPELIPARGEFRSRETLVCSVSKCFRIVKVGS